MTSTQTALDLGRAFIAELRAQHPNTRWSEPTCYAPPCTCPTVQKSRGGKPAHVPHIDRDSRITATGPYGLRRGKDGAYRWPRSTGARFTGELPADTARKMAACAEAGLAYWSDAPRGYVWAVDSARQAYLVRITDGRVVHREPRTVF